MSDRAAVRVLVIGLFAGAVLLFRPWSGAGIDETGYYMWLSSMLFDGDLDQANDHLASGADPEFITRDYYNLSDRGCHPCQFSVGPALIWGAALGPWVGLERVALGGERWRGVDRFAWRFRILISLVTVLAGCHGAILLFHLLRRFYSPGVSLAAAAVATLGSPMLVYLYLLPAMSHVFGFWATTVVWYLSLELRQQGPRRPGGRDWALGMAVGLAALIRWQSAVWAAVPGVIYVAQMIRPGRRLWALGGAALAAVASVFVFSLQCVAWKAVFGQWIYIPQGAGFLFSSDHPLALLRVLFSRWNGLITSHPWIGVALIGLLLWARRAPLPALGALIALASTWVVNAAARDWWGGSAFGARRWIEAMPVFALGWAAVLNALPSGRVRRDIGGGVSIALVILNGVLATLWIRGVLREDWWSQWPLAGDVLRAVLHSPLEWIEGEVWALAWGRPRSLAISLLLLSLVALTLGLAAWVSRGGRIPWPAGRWRRWATVSATVYISCALTAVIWASGRSPHTADHLAVRDALRVSNDPHRQWQALNAPGFPFDPACPVQLAVFSDVALRSGHEVQGIEWLHRLEPQFPRFTGLQVLRLVKDPGERHHAERVLLLQTRWDDPLVQSQLLAAMGDLGPIGLLDPFLQSPTLNRTMLFHARAQCARIGQNSALEETWVRRALDRDPQDVWSMLRLSELAAERGDADAAQRWRLRSRRWCDMRLRTFETLLKLDSPGVHWNREGDLTTYGMALLSSYDPLTEAESISRTLERLRPLPVHYLNPPDWEGLVFHRQWDAARKTSDPAARARLLAELESHAAAHPEQVDGPLALIEIRGLAGDWVGACEALAQGVSAFPDGSDWSEMAQMAAKGLGAEGLATCDLDTLPSEIRGLAAGGLAQRAADLGLMAEARRWMRRAEEEGQSGERLQMLAHHLFIQTWLHARASQSNEERRRLLPSLESYAGEHPEDIDTALALVEINGLIGEWRAACEALARGARRFPDGSDWIEVAHGAARALDVKALSECDLSVLPADVRGLAAAGLALRAGDLGARDQALTYWRRAREEGLTDPRVASNIAALSHR